MKKAISILCCLVVLGFAGLAVAGYHAFGLGKIVAATTTTARVVYTAAVYNVSIFNAGATGDFIHVLFNCTTNQFNTEFSNGNTIPIRGGNWITTPSQRDIQSFCYRSAAGTVAVDYYGL